MFVPDRAPNARDPERPSPQVLENMLGREGVAVIGAIERAVQLHNRENQTSYSMQFRQQGLGLEIVGPNNTSAEQFNQAASAILSRAKSLMSDSEREGYRELSQQIVQPESGSGGSLQFNLAPLRLREAERQIEAITGRFGILGTFMEAEPQNRPAGVGGGLGDLLLPPHLRRNRPE